MKLIYKIIINKYIYISLLCYVNFVLLGQKNWDSSNALNYCVIENGIKFLGVPYKAGTLDVNKEENLICHNDVFDCVTFVEYVLAISIYQLQTTESKKFEEILTDMRYEQGRIEGYGSRLHYFTGWIDQQANTGRFLDITYDLGGIAYHNPLFFMSKNKTLYPKLSDPTAFSKILATEKKLSSSKRYYIPKSKVKNIEAKLESGDIVGITTNIKGLDVIHTGFIYKKDGKAYLLHASEKEKKVCISDLSLAEYLATNPKQSGIIVLRPK